MAAKKLTLLQENKLTTPVLNQGIHLQSRNANVLVSRPEHKTGFLIQSY